MPVYVATYSFNAHRGPIHGYYYCPNSVGEETRTYSYPKVPYVICDRVPMLTPGPPNATFLPTNPKESISPALGPHCEKSYSKRQERSQVWFDRSCTPQSIRQLINIGGTLPPTFSEEPYNMGTNVLPQSWPNSIAPGARDLKARVSN